MNTKALIHIDGWFAPFNALALMLKKQVPISEQNTTKTLCVKFFGLGSIVRILHVVQQSGLKPEDFIFLTLDKNESILNELGFTCVTIRSENIFQLFIDTVKATRLIWNMKSTRVIDFERSSNMASLFSHWISIGKPLTQFSVQAENSKTERISLRNKRATDAIAEALRIPGYLPFQPRTFKTSDRILVNVNSGNYMAERRYPIERFADLINQLANKHKQWKFVFTGMANETEYVSRIEPLLQPHVQYELEVGRLNLQEFIRCIQNVQLVITNDSSPLHLANYFATPCVALWGPTSSALVGYPNSDRMLNISAGLKCSPCFHHPKSKVASACSGRLDCFEELETLNLAEEISRFANKLNEEMVLYEQKN